MNITITGRKCTPRESFRTRAERKLEKIDKFFPGETDAKVVATVEKSHKTVEVTVNAGGMFYRAQENANDLEDALDKCVDTIIRQIRKNKTKLEKRIKSGVLDEFVAEVNADEVSEETAFDLVRTKQVELKPLSVDEAILQMNQLDHIFFFFLNEETNLVSVVYKRNDGGYGLIEPRAE